MCPLFVNKIVLSHSRAVLTIGCGCICTTMAKLSGGHRGQQAYKILTI